MLGIALAKEVPIVDPDMPITLCTRLPVVGFFYMALADRTTTEQRETKEKNMLRTGAIMV